MMTFIDFAQKTRANEIYPDGGLSEASIRAQIERLQASMQRVFETGKWSHIGHGLTKKSALDCNDRRVKMLQSYIADPTNDPNLKHAYDAYCMTGAAG